MLSSTIFYIIDEKAFKKLFKNYCTIGNGYDYASTSLLIIALLIPTISPKLGRNLKIPLFLILLVCYVYLPAFLLRVTLKEKFNVSEFFVTLYPVFFCSGISLVVGNYFSKERFDYKIGTVFGGCFSAGLVFCYVWVLEVYDPYMWQILLFVALGLFWAFYVNYDAFLMKKWRRDVLRKDDWFLGVVCLQTDIFFRFWYYMVLEAFDQGEKESDFQDFEEDDDRHVEMIIATED